MARIRTIKPEFWSHEKIMACSRDARLLFMGLWNFCDDAGRIPSSAKTIKAQIFPGDDDVDSAIIRKWIGELSTNDLLFEYEVDSRLYIQVSGWHHQKIDRPKPSKYPNPDSSNARRAVAPDLILSNLTISNLKSDPPKPVENSGENSTGCSLASALPSGALASSPSTEPVWKRKRPADMNADDWNAYYAAKRNGNA